MKQYQKFGILLLAMVFVLIAFTASCNIRNKSENPISANNNTNTEVKSNSPTATQDPNNPIVKTAETMAALQTAKAENKDAVAWLCVPGTDIDHPVMQTTNNSDYLNRDEHGNYYEWGSYFADYYANLSAPKNFVENTVIYGHSESTEDPDGKKFTQLFRYLDIDFLKENPYLYLTVKDETVAFEVFAVFYTDIEFYYINPTPKEAGFDTFLDTVVAKNEYLFPGITVSEDDNLLTLSTCATLYDTANTRNHRFVVMGKRVDSTTTDAPNVTLNPAPERP